MIMEFYQLKSGLDEDLDAIHRRRLGDRMVVQRTSKRFCHDVAVMVPKLTSGCILWETAFVYKEAEITSSPSRAQTQRGV